MRRRPVMLTLLVIAALALFVTVRAASALTPRVIAYWDRVGFCETHGNWGMRGSTYSGGTGMANTTYRWWARELGLLRRYPNAADAPRLVQIAVSDYGYRVHHGYWACFRVVGMPW